MRFNEFEYLELCNELMCAIDNNNSKEVEKRYDEVINYINSAIMSVDNKMYYKEEVILMVFNKIMEYMEEENKGCKEVLELEKELSKILHPTL